MKRLWLLLSTILLVLLSGCSKSEKPDNKLSDEPMEIPETLIVDADLPQNLPSEASTYKVSYKDFDSDQLLECFHMEPDSFRERDALGQRFESGDSLLYVYDDEGVLYGGFEYTKDISARDGTITEYTDSDFVKDKASDNFSDTEALSFLGTLGLNQGLGQLKTVRVYEFSGEDLNEFTKAYNECMKSWNEGGNQDEFVERDEGAFNPEDHYAVVYLAQFIDDIPFITVPWGNSGKQTCSEARVIIFEHQMMENRFVQLYDVEQEISKDKIISPEAALNAFIADYNKEMHFDTTTITAISLNYVVTFDKDGMYAQPAYIFEYNEYQAKSEDSPRPIIIGEKYSYSYKVISARNGEFILSPEVGT